ncbi:MAG: gamma-butyrobetaine hydroxylase-like domain-containing protein, partial [Rhodospirillaceae bacterium]|nr:gamma-butyrobetaine hydroxylase-like domain-containing protein [Rhodospirillaceae bacterium]
MTESAPIPISLKLRRRSRRLEVSFSDGKTFDLSAEYLRVHSPSAEVQGHA